MRFVGLTATEFTMLFSSAAFLAVVFYLLSFRRRTAVMAAEPIWRLVVGRRKTPYRKLLALLVQILILFVLALTLADPRFESEDAPPPVAMVAVVDVSASMSAMEGDSRRLDQAIDLVKRLAAELGPRDRMMLMAMDDECRPLTGFLSDPDQLTAAAQALEPSAVDEDFARAIRFAAAALNGEGFDPRARRRVVLVSDRFHSEDELAVEGQAPLEFLQVAIGQPGANLAITAFEVRRRGGAARGHEVFVEVTNFGVRGRKVTLSIHTASELLGEETLDVAARGKQARSYFLKPVSSDRILATITGLGVGSRADRFALDDQAFALLPRRESRRVLLVTSGNVFLEKALGLDPSLTVEVVGPTRFTPAMLGGRQAVVFDGLCPAAQIPAIYFAPPAGPGCPFASTDEVNFPALLPVRGDHPVTDDLTLVDIQIERARHLVPLPGDTELLADAKGPLILARDGDGSKRLAFGFDVAKSDLPLRIAFPMMMHNALGWFLGRKVDLGAEEYAIGRLARLPDWVGADTRVSDPMGRRVSPLMLGGRAHVRLRWPGFYAIEAAGRQALLPANFHSPQESSLGGDRRVAVDKLTWPADEVPEVLVAGFDKAVQEEPPIQWPLLLLAVAWLLLFDWMFFCFRMLF